jgi:hypothetical protein
MAIQSKVNVHFFESRKDIDVSGPYATISAEELGAVTRRFASWRDMLTTHPRLAESLGDASTAHIALATDLELAIMESRRENTYPNIILPMGKFTTAMTVMRLSRTVVLEPEFGEMLAEENRKWEANTPADIG